MKQILGKVRCEACGWTSKPDVIIEDFLEESCPTCGIPLMDEADKACFRSVKALVQIGAITVWPTTEQPPPDGRTVFTYNSREGIKVKKRG